MLFRSLLEYMKWPHLHALRRKQPHNRVGNHTADMDVIFLSNNPVNSKVIGTKDDTHLYDISMQRTSDSRDVYSITTLRRPDGEVVAQWEWSAHNRYQDRITYLGDVHTLSEWLAKESPFSRYVVSKWRWRRRRTVFTGRCRTRLDVPANDTKYRWKKAGFSMGRNTNLEVSDST